MMRPDCRSIFALQASSDLDAQLAVAIGDDEEDAAVFTLPPHAPRATQVNRVVLDRL